MSVVGLLAAWVAAAETPDPPPDAPAEPAPVEPIAVEPATPIEPVEHIEPVEPIDPLPVEPAPPTDGPFPAPLPTPASDPTVPTNRRGRPLTPYTWGGIGLPTINYNSTDGLALGAGAELYDRPRGNAFGFRYHLSLSTLWTTSGNYSSNYVQLERRGAHYWMVRATYRHWRNMVYIGSGGEAVATMNGDEAFGNTVTGPSFLANVTRRIHRTPISLFVQGYARYAHVEARPDGPLDTLRPFGVDGGFHVDLGGGLYLQETDRWPMPNKGGRAELSARVGGAWAGRFAPLMGMNAEAMGWWPLAGEWLVVGGRALFDKTWGERVFWEQENLGGIMRDELAYEQMLTGYSRSRTRGDGTAAALIELRPKFGETGHDVVDIGFYLSTYAEIAWLFKGNDPGPPMPSVGVAPYLLWQGAVELRPFMAWGWLSDTPDGPRRPQSTIGVSLLGVL